MIKVIEVIDDCIIFGAIPNFILYKFGFNRGQKDMINKILLIVEKTKKEKGV